MVTDDKRREVARRLRAYLDTPAPWNLGNAVSNALGECGDYDNIELLADLIDPDTTTDTTSHRLEDRLISPIASQTVDRDALLKLADEMDFISGLGITESFTPSAVREYAYRIREALGMTDDD